MIPPRGPTLVPEYPGTGKRAFVLESLGYQGTLVRVFTTRDPVDSGENVYCYYAIVAVTHIIARTNVRACSMQRGNCRMRGNTCVHPRGESAQHCLLLNKWRLRFPLDVPLQEAFRDMENDLALQEPPCHLLFAARVATTVITKSAVGFGRELVRKMTLCEPSHMPECPWPGLGPCETPPDRPDLPAGGRHGLQEAHWPGFQPPMGPTAWFHTCTRSLRSVRLSRYAFPGSAPHPD